MATKAEQPPSPKMARIIAQLREGCPPPVEPVQADWDAGNEYTGTCFSLWNTRLGRQEWFYGRIPRERLSDYD